MKTKSVKVLPKMAGEILNGGVYAQAVRCGKSNCKCARGEAHTAFYFLTRRAGKLVKFYVRKSELNNFAALAAQAAEARKVVRRTTKLDQQFLRELHQFLREKNRLINNLKGL